MTVEILNRSGERVAIPSLEGDARFALRMLGTGNNARIISIVYVRPVESRRLARSFLKKDTPANVLSFDYGGYAEVILAPSVIRTEAKREGTSFRNLMRRMLVHGLVHIAGFHHETSARDARIFERHERVIFAKRNILINSDM